jgi:hypothetical protein
MRCAPGKKNHVAVQRTRQRYHPVGASQHRVGWRARSLPRPGKTTGTASVCRRLGSARLLLLVPWRSRSALPHVFCFTRWTGSRFGVRIIIDGGRREQRKLACTSAVQRAVLVRKKTFAFLLPMPMQQRGVCLYSLRPPRFRQKQEIPPATQAQPATKNIYDGTAYLPA